MKLACASGAFHRRLEHGDLTQLEFLELCARDIRCDGVVLDVRHFPRTDNDYLAQIKKAATDLGLDIAAVADRRAFGEGSFPIAQTLEWARTLGAPLLAATLDGERARPWSAQLEALGRATALAKAANVTLAVRNAPGTFAASVHDCRRVAKEADSAWLRFGLDPHAFDGIDDPAALTNCTVLLWSDAGAHYESSVDAMLNAFPAYAGYVAIDEPSGTIDAPDATSAVRTWRIALASRLLNHT